MKQTIRLGTFETNSSSTHSLVMCSADIFKSWKDKKLLFDDINERFEWKQDVIEKILKEQTKEEILKYWDKFSEREYNDVDEYEKEQIFQEALESYIRKKNNLYTYEDYWDIYGNDFEIFEKHYTTIHRDEVVAFGYYGYDD